METLAYNRLRSRRYVRARARGLSREVAARAAGYHEAGATRIERRLKGEIAQERKKLAGMNGGHIPARFGAKDARRIARAELERLVDHFGPNHATIVEQTLRSLAVQVPKSIAYELLGRYHDEHMKLKRDGSFVPRSELLVDYAGRLYAECAKLGGREADATPTQSAAPSASPPTCPRHSSVQLGGHKTCPWCDGLDPVRRRGGFRDQDAVAEDHPTTYAPTDW